MNPLSSTEEATSRCSAAYSIGGHFSAAYSIGGPQHFSAATYSVKPAAMYLLNCMRKRVAMRGLKLLGIPGSVMGRKAYPAVHRPSTVLISIVSCSARLCNAKSSSMPMQQKMIRVFKDENMHVQEMKIRVFRNENMHVQGKVDQSV